MLTVSEAYQGIMAFVPEVRTSVVDLREAGGAILAEPVFADRDYPPINRSTMDGIAINLESWEQGVRAWTIEATLAAGIAARELQDPTNGCVQIMTGAELPDNADGVIPFEDITVTERKAAARPAAHFKPGLHVHVRGLDRKSGELLLSEGMTLDAPRLAIMAAVGHAKVRVALPPAVGILSTGNEIVAVDKADPSPVQVRASNLVALETALRQTGVTDIVSVHVGDDLAATTKEIKHLLATRDLLILSGGVSMGKYDFVPEALRQSGVREIFHKVAQKPGKPLWFGQANSCLVFGLPGNPVSTLTVFRRYAVPFILASMGKLSRTPHARSEVTLTPHPTLTTFPPVRVIERENGVLTVEPVNYHGSGDFAALAESSGFVEVPPGGDTIIPDTPLPFFPWREFGS